MIEFGNIWLIVLSFAGGFFSGIVALMVFVYALTILAKIKGWTVVKKGADYETD